MAEATIDLEAMQSLVDTMNTAAGDLRGAKSELTGILGGVSLDTSPPQPLEAAALWVDSQVPGLRRRLALAQVIAAARPGFHGPVQIDESKLSTLSPNEAEKIGREAAARIRDGSSMDAELVGWLNQYSGDPYFAAALAKGCSPEEISDYLQAVSANMRASTQSPSYSEGGEDSQFMKDRANWNLLVTGLSQTLGTATRSQTPDLALPADYADRFADSITTDSRRGQAAVLGLLLKNGTFGTSFLDTVSTKVYDYERNELGTWRERLPTQTEWAMMDEQGRPLNVGDPLAGILSALGRNAEAAQHFFTGGGTKEVEIHGQKVQVGERLQYLLQERTWAERDHSDEGDGLGKALRAATIAFRNRDASGMTSASIASQTIALVGSKTNEGSDGGWFGIGKDDGWKMYTGMRDEIADIVADYAPDLFREYSDAQGAEDTLGPPWSLLDNPADLPGGPYGMVFNRDDMQKILKTLGEDPANIDKIAVSAFAFNRVKVNYALSQVTDPALKWKILSGVDVPEFVNPSMVGPSVVGAILQDAYDGMSDKVELEKAKAEALKSWLDVAGSLPILKIPGEGLKAAYADWGVDQLKSAALDKLGEGPATDPGSLYGGREVADQEALRRDTMNLLLQNGFYDPDVVALGSKELGGKGASAPPAGALLRDSHGNVTGFDFGSDDYANWVQGTSGPGNPAWWGLAPGMQLPESVIDKYRSQFPNIK